MTDRRHEGHWYRTRSLADTQKPHLRHATNGNSVFMLGNYLIIGTLWRENVGKAFRDNICLNNSFRHARIAYLHSAMLHLLFVISNVRVTDVTQDFRSTQTQLTHSTSQVAIFGSFHWKCGPELSQKYIALDLLIFAFHYAHDITKSV